MADDSPKLEAKDLALSECMRCLGEFANKDDQLDQLVHLTIRGLSYVERQPELLRILNKDDPSKAADLERADAAAKVAKNEASDDYPLLHAQAVMSLWASLEASVRTLLATLMRVHGPARDVQALKKVKVHLATYEALEELERSLYVLDLLEETIGTRRRPGAGRFDDLCAAFGMTVTTPAPVVQCLLEFYHVRNVLMHRHGRVDRRFLKDCPWLSLTEGTELLVSHRLYHHYSAALNRYMGELTNRIRAYFGLPPFEHRVDCTPEMREFEHDARLLSERSQRGRVVGEPAPSEN
jgi:hypothetical protein